jgi:hypothetical protein
VADDERADSWALLDLGEAGQVVTTPCPACGTWLQPEDCAEVTTFGDPRPEYIPMRCPTPGCGTTCRTCRRPPGDVHGAHCGDRMALKVERPHIVDRSDL